MTFTVDLAFLILRLMIGLTLMAHGSQKLFGWFGGAGFKATQVGFEKQGFMPGWFWLSLAALGEFGGGLSLASGFLTPLGAAGVFGAMAMATFKTHWKNGFFLQNHGYEYSLTLMVTSIFFGLAGPGDYSLDHMLGLALPEVGLFIGLAVAAAIVTGAGILISQAAQHAPAKS